MLDWFKGRGQRPKPLASMTLDELDALFDGHPELAVLLRNTLGLMQFAPARMADQILLHVTAIIDDVLRQRLSPTEEHDYVMREMEALRGAISERPGSL